MSIPRLTGAPETIGDSWALVTGNTLRKTGPQLLLAGWFWGITPQWSAALAETAGLWMLPVMAAGLLFWALVFIRVMGVSPRGDFPSGFAALPFLFLGYGLWLGFTLPIHTYDVREWLGWSLMATGLMACTLAGVWAAAW
jgi:hypothetical protein